MRFLIPVLAVLFTALVEPSLVAQNSPSIESLNDQMNQLEKLLGIPGESVKTPAVEKVYKPSADRRDPQFSSELPSSLHGIEEKLIELESMTADLASSEIEEQVDNDPWDIADSNLSTPIDMLPRIEISSGMVVRYVPQGDSFLAVNTGDLIKTQTLFVIPSNSELVVSFIGKAAARFSENSRVVLGPPQDGTQVVDLRNGTVAAHVDNQRDSASSIRFRVRTHSGFFESTGAFFAVTEYLGQSFVEVKSGKVKKVPHASSNSKFISYLRKNTIAKRAQPEEKITEADQNR